MSDVAPPPPPEAPAPDPIPWEQPGLPWTTAMVETIKGVITAPTPTLARIPVNGDFLKPLLYAILLGWIGSWAEFLWSSVTDQFTAGLLGGGGSEQMETMAITGAMGIMFALFAPLITTVILFLGSAVTHLFVMLFASGGSGYWGTFKVMCYVTGTTSLASLIPVCGSYAGALWNLVLLILGIAVVHKVSHGKSAAIVLLPALLFCACMAVVGAMFGAAIMTTLSEG